jgi:hypothetical protein
MRPARNTLKNLKCWEVNAKFVAIFLEATFCIKEYDYFTSERSFSILRHSFRQFSPEVILWKPQPISSLSLTSSSRR